LYIKPRDKMDFAIVDAGMNDFMRPALYGAYHDIEAVMENENTVRRYTIVGPICESSDVLGKDRMLALKEGDFLAIKDTGAYGMSMASHYNTRPKPAEILVDGSAVRMIRRRDHLEEILAPEL
jgi:diaminopimelate decarboxylase